MMKTLYSVRTQYLSFTCEDIKVVMTAMYFIDVYMTNGIIIVTCEYVHVCVWI